MRRPTPFIMCAWFFATSLAYGQSYLSLESYIELERAAVNKSDGSPVVTIYLGGVIEALGFANARLKHGGSRPIFCAPQSGISAAKLRVLIESYIAKNRSLMNKADFQFFEKAMNVGAISVDLLRENFPCR